MQQGQENRRKIVPLGGEMFWKCRSTEDKEQTVLG